MTTHQLIMPPDALIKALETFHQEFKKLAAEKEELKAYLATHGESELTGNVRYAVECLESIEQGLDMMKGGFAIIFGSLTAIRVAAHPEVQALGSTTH